MHKPDWLDKKISFKDCLTKKLLTELGLHTVCQEARCPNISECFLSGVATFMILGNICTRDCLFCAVNKGKPLKVDYSQPYRILEAVKKLKLKYVVITSPTRDDLEDKGAGLFYKTVKVLKEDNPKLIVELLIPDFLGNLNSIKLVAESSAEIIGHNLETVPSLYNKVRPKASYRRSLEVLRVIKEINPKLITKSAIMLGLGEKKEEVLEVMADLRKVNCDFIVLGQYLAPSLKHYPVKEYIPLKDFLFFEEKAKSLGFKGVKSLPYARSSYFADTLFKGIKPTNLI